jgi:hypothetical protein
MATAEQIKALLESHVEGDDDRFLSIVLQLAARAARQGHGKLAQELRAIDQRQLFLPVGDNYSCRLPSPGWMPPTATAPGPEMTPPW